MNTIKKMFALLGSIALFFAATLHCGELNVQVGIRKTKDKDHQNSASIAEYTMVVKSTRKQGMTPFFTSDFVDTSFGQTIQKHLLFNGDQEFRFSTETINDPSHKSLDQLKNIIKTFNGDLSALKDYMATHSVTKINSSSSPADISNALSNALDHFQQRVATIIIDSCKPNATIQQQSSALDTLFNEYFNNKLKKLNASILSRIIPTQTTTTSSSASDQVIENIKNQFANDLANSWDEFQKQIKNEYIKLYTTSLNYTPVMNLLKKSDYTKPYRELYVEIQRLGKFFGFECQKLEKYDSIGWLGIVSTIGIGAIAYGAYRYFASRSVTCPPAPACEPTPASKIPTAPTPARTPLTLKPSTQLPPRPQ